MSCFSEISLCDISDDEIRMSTYLFVSIEGNANIIIPTILVGCVNQAFCCTFNILCFVDDLRYVLIGYLICKAIRAQKHSPVDGSTVEIRIYIIGCSQ